MTDIEEALVRFATRCGFGLVFGIGLAMIFSLDPVFVAFGATMICAVFPECFGFNSSESMQFEFVEDELDA